MNKFYFWHSLVIGMLMISSFFWGKSYSKDKVSKNV